MKLMKRATALLLCFLMLTNGPISAFATEGTDNVVVETTTTETVETCEECGGSDAHTDTCSLNTINLMNNDVPVACTVCGTENCETTHVYCDTCAKYDCGLTHTTCDKCGTVDCTSTHEAWCDTCKVDSCGIDHATPTEDNGSVIDEEVVGCTECKQAEGHAETCSQYVAPVAKCEHCGIELTEGAVHADDCLTLCTCTPVDGVHQEGCKFYEAPIEEISDNAPQVGDKIWINSGSRVYKNQNTVDKDYHELLGNYEIEVVSILTDEAGNAQWYEFKFTDIGIGEGILLLGGYKYVHVDNTSVEEPSDEPIDENACNCGENAPENIANHTDGCPRKEYIKTQINLTVDQIVSNWDSYDAETQSDILDMLKVWDSNKYEELAGKVDENEPAVPAATVSGAPEGYSLEIQNVTIDINEFGIENAEDFIAALDISLEKDGLAWQGNDEQESVAVSVDMTQYDIADGTVVRVHHQHDGEITTIEPLIIINGKLTFATDGFSVFVVEKAHETTPLEPIEGTTITMTVGEEKTFYWTEGDTVTTYNSAHFWVVDDPEGYIYPQVHSMGAKTHFGYHWYEQHQAPWITIKANKATPEGEPITLTMKYGQTKSEEFTLIVVNPEGLYIQDDLVDNGVLIPQGIDTEGVTFVWSRSDGQNVNAAAISEGGKLNVSIDRGGMTPSRTSPITYTVTAKNSEGTEIGTAKYTVNYSTQIMNNSFENPTVTNVDGYQSYPNNYAGLYWKTTAPGSGATRSMDVELMVNGNTSYLAGQAQMVVADGNQAAELNAEAVGTLYQDLLTTPGSTLTWSVSHAARTSETSNNTMYIIVAATKAAQNITTATDVKALLDSIPAGDRENINNPEMTAIGYQHDYNGVTFYIWKHTATRDASAQDQWHQLSGSVRIPDGQYLTRFFFASDPYATTDATKGNLIDGVAAAEMLRYRIQYHIDGVLDSSKNQTGTAAVTTTVSVRELKSYLENGYEFDTEKDGGYIQINGTSHVDDYNPADKSLGLYITDYPGSSGDANTPILMDIYLKTSETELTITKSGWDILDPNQTFLFDVSGTNIKGEAFELTVAIVGNGSTTITGLKVGTECTVKEITEWSWRYTPDDAEQTVTLVTDPEQNKITFVNTRPNIYWLDGNAHKNNVFGAILKDDE